MNRIFNDFIYLKSYSVIWFITINNNNCFLMFKILNDDPNRQKEVHRKLYSYKY